MEVRWFRAEFSCQEPREVFIWPGPRRNDGNAVHGGDQGIAIRCTGIRKGILNSLEHQLHWFDGILNGG